MTAGEFARLDLGESRSMLPAEIAALFHGWDALRFDSAGVSRAEAISALDEAYRVVRALSEGEAGSAEADSPGMGFNRYGI
jgi:hypothetical protein